MKLNLIGQILVVCILFTTTNGAEWKGRNAKLKDLPEGTWLKICKYNGENDTLGGSSEVPWTYDIGNKQFVRVGGCTGYVISYGNSVVLFDMGTETTTAPWGGSRRDVTDRPGGGCQRGVCYDPVSKLVYQYGGGANNTTGWDGLYGLWKGDMATKSWTQLRNVNTYGGNAQLAADTANKLIVIMGRATSGFRTCQLYFPAGDSMVFAPVIPNNTALIFNINQDWWPTLQYAPALNGTMYFAWMNGVGWFTWLFDAKTRTWTDLKPTGLENAPGVANYVSEGYRAVLSYDNANNVMLVHIPKHGIYVYNQVNNSWDKVSETNYQPTFVSQMFDYDDEHNVHVLVNYVYAYDKDVWAFRYKNVNQLKEEKAGKSHLISSLTCSPNPLRNIANIKFGMSKRAHVHLALYDIRGRLHSVLLNEIKQAGEHNISTAVKGLASGNYILKLSIEGRTEIKNILVTE